MSSEYAKEIQRTPLLSEEETKELLIRKTAGDKDARNKLITHNMRLVLKLAYKYQSKIDLPLDDLIGIGTEGLIKAIDNFDTSYEVKISTVAYPYIENVFKRYIYLSKMPKRDSEGKLVSLNDPVYEGKDGDELTLESLLSSDIDLEDEIIKENRVEKMRKILDRLTQEEREILYLRFGITDGIEHTLEEIGQMKNLTRESIRQKEARAIMKLRHPRITRQIKDFFE